MRERDNSPARKKKKSWESLGDVLRSKKMGKFSTLVEEYKLRSSWREIVGESLAEKTLPARVYRDTLKVYVASSVLSNQLYFLKSEILSKIKTVAGIRGLKEIKFQVRSIPKGAFAKSEPVKNNTDTGRNGEVPIEGEQLLESSSLAPETKRIIRDIFTKLKLRGRGKTP